MFLEQALGMVMSDRIEAEHLGSSVYGSFYHCNPRHHSIALLALPAPALPGVLHHVMVEAASRDDVSVAYDRARAARAPIAMGRGKHATDRLFSFYSVTPAAFQMEVGYHGGPVGYVVVQATHDDNEGMAYGGRPADPQRLVAAGAMASTRLGPISAALVYTHDVLVRSAAGGDKLSFNLSVRSLS